MESSGITRRRRSYLRLGSQAADVDKHEIDVTVLLFHKGKVYSGGDDGIIKSWTTDLTKIAEVEAHSTSVYSLAASDDSLYSCSSDGTIKQFDLGTLKETAILANEEKTEYWKLYYANGFLYSGDNIGNVVLWKDGKVYGETNVAEPIKDMVVSGNILYTVKDNDVVITELKLDAVQDGRLQFAVKKSIMGRFPLTLVDKNLVMFSSREGTDITVIENNDETHFKTVATIDGAHGQEINALTGTTLNGNTYFFSGGWDKTVKKWKLDGDIAKLDCATDVDFVINAFAVGESGEIYAAGTHGYLLRIEIIE